ncbi:hypothetical protein [Pseudonocardia sp. HH130630-07]|uniref:hypothetical protein n=1 Tax=Pseudonocardia sp. HH130630-07 TaxID=1690815 RepID=UPI0012EA4797|nr:hypothetical protein [Pseudonocardia sp. HH130630-07]
MTPEPVSAGYTRLTGEHSRIHRRLLETCTAVHLSTVLTGTDGQGAVLSCVYTGRTWHVPADAVLLVTGAVPDDDLAHELERRTAGGGPAVHRIGDCLAYGTIAAAVHSGHLFGRELSVDLPDRTPYARDATSFEPTGPVLRGAPSPPSSTLRRAGT